MVGTTVNWAVSIAPLCDAVMVTEVGAAIGRTMTVKVALTCASVTRTAGGTTTRFGWSLMSVISAPPLGAMSFKKIVPVFAVSPAATEGVKVMTASSGATVKVFESVSPLSVAVISAG